MDLPVNLKALVQSVIKEDPEYLRLKDTVPLAAHYILENTIKEFTIWYNSTYKEHRDKIRDINEHDPPKNMRQIGEIPLVFVRLLANRLGRQPSAEELKDFLKLHEEFRTVKQV